MSEIIMGIDGMDSEESRLEVINALYRYSGVLDVDVSPAGTAVRVRYDPGNILARDLKDSVEEAGYRVSYIRR
ncbi:MAG: heavy-metal-associated domain-containing protein [Peptococcaceae bacterium]|nr:heavy-metal-associated domain-containing protein [Peptococcaceae bacterium]